MPAGDLLLMLAELALLVAAALFIRLVRSVTRHQAARDLALRTAVVASIEPA